MSTKTTIVAITLCVLPACIAPIKTDIQGIRNNMDRLEKIIDQKADNTVVAEHVNEINNKIEQTNQIAEELSLWRKSVQADTINYGGAGWVVVSAGLIVAIFLGAGLLLVRAFMKRGHLLKLVTCAVQKVGQRLPYTMTQIKDQLKNEVSSGDRFTEQDRKSLGDFARKVGTFCETK